MQPAEAREVINDFTYFVDVPYRVRPPKVVLEEKRAHCLEAALVAAFLLPNLPQKLLYITTDKPYEGTDNTFSHAVFLLEQGVHEFSSIGVSRHPQLIGRTEFFPSVVELAQTYVDAYEEMGVSVLKVSVADMNGMPIGVNWRELYSDITFINSMLEIYGQDIMMDL